MNRKNTLQRPKRASANGRPGPLWTVARLRRHFGMIPAERFLLHPRPGMATEDDLIYVNTHDRLCELVDGVLVEKAMGAREAMMAGILLHWMWHFLEKHDLGIVLGADGTVKFFPDLIRAPDVSFISWARLPGGELPEDPVPRIVPDLAIEVISKGNTKKEMERKLGEYFGQGVRLVWLIYPKKRIVEVYTSPESKRVLRNSEILDGGDVLPGFRVPLAELFAPRRRRKA